MFSEERCLPLPKLIQEAVKSFKYSRFWRIRSSARFRSSSVVGVLIVTVDDSIRLKLLTGGHLPPFSSIFVLTLISSAITKADCGIYPCKCPRIYGYRLN